MGLSEIDRDLGAAPSGGGLAAIDQDLSSQSPAPAPAGNWWTNLIAPVRSALAPVTSRATDVIGRGAEALTEPLVGLARMQQGESFDRAFGPETFKSVGHGGAAKESRQEVASSGLRVGVPAAAALLTGGASIPAQMLAQGGAEAALQASGVNQSSLPWLAFSTALPMIPGLLARTGRGVERTATRAVPGAFKNAQEKAQGALQDVIEQLRPAEGETTRLFQTARAESTLGRIAQDTLPMPELTQALQQADQNLLRSPLDPAGKLAREAIQTAEELMQNGGMALDDVMKLRKTLGPLSRQSPEVANMFRASMADLEHAARGAVQTGAPGAQAAVGAYDAARRGRAAELLEGLRVKNTFRTPIMGADVEALNMSKFAKAVEQDQNLARVLRPKERASVEGFIKTFRSLPPTHAFTWANKVLLSTGGIAGLLTGAWIPAAAAMLGMEVGVNAIAAGANPRAVYQIGTPLAAMAKGFLANEAASGPRMRDIAGGRVPGLATSGDLVKDAARGH